MADYWAYLERVRERARAKIYRERGGWDTARERTRRGEEGGQGERETERERDKLPSTEAVFSRQSLLTANHKRLCICHFFDRC